MKEKDLESSAEYVAGFADGFKSGLSKNFVQNHLVGKEFDCDDDIAFFEGYNKGCSDFCEQFIRLINGDDYISAYEMNDWLEDKRNEAEAATEAGYDEPEAFPSLPPIIIFTRILDFVEDLKEGKEGTIEELMTVLQKLMR